MQALPSHLFETTAQWECLVCFLIIVEVSVIGQLWFAQLIFVRNVWKFGLFS